MDCEEIEMTIRGKPDEIIAVLRRLLSSPRFKDTKIRLRLSHMKLLAEKIGCPVEDLISTKHEPEYRT